MKYKSEDPVGSLQKAMSLLERLSQPPYALKADELAEELNYNRTTTYRTLQLMVRQGAVVQDPESKKYMIGSWLYHVGDAFRQTRPYEPRARELINELAVELGHAVGLAIVERGRFFTFIETSLQGDDMLNELEGRPCPPNAGAYGKCLMAFQSDEFIRDYLSTHELMRPQPAAVTDIPTLMAEYMQIRECGWSLAVAETIPDHASVGVPIFDPSGAIFGCLAAAAPMREGWEDAVDILRAALLDAKPRMEALLTSLSEKEK